MWQHFLWKHRRKIIFAILITLSISILFLQVFPNTIFLKWTAPFYKLTSKIKFKISNSIDSILKLKNLHEENKLLRTQVSLLNKTNIQYEELLNENSRLRNLLNFKPYTSKKQIGAFVIGYDPSNLFESIIIDKGDKDNILKNMIVVNDKGLIGRIISVTSNSAKTILITDMESSVSAIVQRSRCIGALVGIEQNMCEMKYLAQNNDVQIGDAVISSGEGEIFPKGIPIGIVSNVEKKKDGVTLKVDVRPFADFSKLEEVFVILD